jgi:hypothetical protein
MTIINLLLRNWIVFRKLIKTFLSPNEKIN